MPGATWSVDADATSLLLAQIDVDATDYCNAAGFLVAAYDDASAGLTGSSRVRSAFSEVFESRDSVPHRIAGRVYRSAGAAITSAEQVVFADDRMAADLTVRTPAEGASPLFDAARFGDRG